MSEWPARCSALGGALCARPVPIERCGVKDGPNTVSRTTTKAGGSFRDGQAEETRLGRTGGLITAAERWRRSPTLWPQKPTTPAKVLRSPPISRSC